MAQNFTWPSVSVTATNPSVGLNGQSPSVTSSTLVAGQDPSGDQQVLQTDASGNLLVALDASVQPIAVDATIVSPVGSQVIADSVAVAIASDQTVPISAASLPLPTGAATEVTLLTLATEATLLTLATETTLSAIDTKIIKADTDNVTVVSSVLPTGAATEATLLTLATEVTLSSIDAKIIKADTDDVTVTSSVLPTGAATETTLSSIDGKLPATLGQKTSANSFAVVLASDQSSIPVTFTAAGKASQGFARLDYSGTPVTTSAYTTVIASTSGPATEMFIFDSSGQTLKIAFGAAASEVDQFLVVPGGNGTIPIAVPAGTRISIRAVSATASVGELDLNLLG